jgi:hypothetical protein
MAAVSVRPPEPLLAAFELDRLRPLQGGQGTAWGTAALVFKPVDMSIEALQWQKRVLGSIEEDGFRLARPVRAATAASSSLTGAHGSELAASASRGDGPRSVLPASVPTGPAPRSPYLTGTFRRTDPFARADRAAWDDGAVEEFTALPAAARLATTSAPSTSRAS